MNKLPVLVFLFFVCWVDARTKTKMYTKPPNTLELLHVVFRHGDRTQDGSYPNDPYQNDTFYPVGMGQLTNAGKRRAFKIGTYLRKTYRDFLGKVYTPGILEANSSPYPRCKATLQLVLAGLYPPAENQRWSDNLDWQPIPYDYTPISQNYIFWAYAVCPKFTTSLASYMKSESYERIYEPYADVLRYLKEKSGITSAQTMALQLHSTLKSQEEWGMVLPEWTRSVWPEPITQLTELDWQQMFAPVEARTLGAGFLMSKIVNDTQLTINRDPSIKGLKIHLYSGHDMNIAAILSWLGTLDLHIPEYGSFIIFEIHNISGKRHINIINQNYEYETPQLVEIPNCGFSCPLDKFLELYSQYLHPFDLCY